MRAGAYVVELVETEFSDWDCGQGRPRSLSAVEALRLALCHLRRNSTYGELGSDVGVSASTAWAYVQLMTMFLAEVLGQSQDELREAVAGKVCLVDGSLVPTFNWRHRADLYSGKHRSPGVNVQAIVDLHGRLVAMSKAYPGCRHDAWCFRAAGLAELLASAGGPVGDSGYQGCDLIAPIKKKPGLDRAESDIEFNTELAKLRGGAEWAIAHVKNWRILASRYRGDLSRIDAIVQAVAGLQVLNERFSARPLSFARVAAIGVSE